MDIIETLRDEYYRATGKVGLWNTELYTADFVRWLIGKRAAEIIEYSRYTTDNKQMAAALWREIRHKCTQLVPLRSDWVPITEKRLNSAVTKVLGL